MSDSETGEVTVTAETAETLHRLADEALRGGLADEVDEREAIQVAYDELAKTRFR